MAEWQRSGDAGPARRRWSGGRRRTGGGAAAERRWSSGGAAERRRRIAAAAAPLRRRLRRRSGRVGAPLGCAAPARGACASKEFLDGLRPLRSAGPAGGGPDVVEALRVALLAPEADSVYLVTSGFSRRLDADRILSEAM